MPTLSPPTLTEKKAVLGDIRHSCRAISSGPGCRPGRVPERPESTRRMSSNLPPGLQFRLLRPEDSLTELTSLLHRAYSGLAEMGFRYLASHQSEEVTAERVATGECVVGVLDGRLVATITLVPAGVLNGTPWYEHPGVAVIKQLAVEPALQSRGIRSALMDRM